MKTFIKVSNELREACEKKMAETIAKVQTRFPNKTIPTPQLKFRQMGHRAGVCSPRQSLVVINPDYFKNHYDDMLNDTVPHEVCHFISVFLYDTLGSGHGHYWKKVMEWAGIPYAERCHSYSTEGVKVRNSHKDYKYSCRCSNLDHWMTPRAHDNICHGGKYRCKQCRGYLVYEGRKSGSHFIPADKSKQVEPKKIIPAIPTRVTRRNILDMFIGLPMKKPATQPPQPKPVEEESGFRVVTRFLNGTLQNERVPIGA
jgi:SprT protein